MSLYKRVETLLEFDKIKNIIKEKTISPMAQELVSSLGPSEDEDTVLRLQQETQEGVVLLESDTKISLRGLKDIRPALRRAKVGATLSPGELLSIASCMRVSRLIKETWDKASLDEVEIIHGIISNLQSFLSIEERIERAIISEDELADNASPKLSSLRRRKKTLSRNIRNKLNDIISSPHLQKFLQDPIVTMRKDRFVVPVKLEYRAYFSGVIHDQSASGSTLYMEPMAVVEMNNELSRLDLEENREIERILREFSTKIWENHDLIYTSLEALARLDFILAKAGYSLDLGGVQPKINTQGIIDIIQGRHPLLTDPVVPIDVRLGEGYSTLVITGPNTGGKTVSLKTVGLFTLMAQSGLQVPAKEGTRLSIFEGVYADIGDEQSIEQSLSTFSGHMKNICKIVERASGKSLVLLDELGAGTDPTEGSALAMAILDYFYAQGTKVMATTHYSELKTYAYTKPGVENASVEFDVKTLSPTYKLTIGLPGKSNAFEISKRLGLNDKIISIAKEYVEEDSLKLEEMLKHIEFEHKKAQEDSARLLDLKRQYQDKVDQLEAEREKIERQRDEILEKARDKAKSLLEELERQTDDVVSQLKESTRGTATADQDRAIEKARSWLRQSRKKIAKPSSKSLLGVASSKDQGPLKLGEMVLIEGLNQEGHILNIDEETKSAQVQVGIMKLNVPLKSLSKTEVDEEEEKSKYTSIGLEKLKSFSKEIDLRGKTLDEALYDVDKYLDDAQVAGVADVMIIHGKGTGVLRRGIEDMLRQRPGIKSFRPGRHDEGGSGVTVVEIK